MILRKEGICQKMSMKLKIFDYLIIISTDFVIDNQIDTMVRIYL
jgi:hypothetical protein